LRWKKVFVLRFARVAVLLALVLSLRLLSNVLIKG
jgi:hypothetical protein